MDFTDHGIIVTGGGTGIGRQIALTLARQGGRVALAGRRSGPLEAVAAELRALGPEPLVVPTDVADEAQARGLVERALEVFGRLDVLVNNAAVHGPTRLARDVTGAEWRETIAVNLTGAFYCASAASGPMIAAGRGCIVNVGSVVGRMGYSLRTPYTASKWGLIGLSHSLAAELGPHGVRVNAVLPGPVEGERLAEVIRTRAEAQGKSIEEVEAWFARNNPLRRVITPAEVAEAVRFLASPAASGITGQALSVCGGFWMQ